MPTTSSDPSSRAKVIEFASKLAKRPDFQALEPAQQMESLQRFFSSADPQFKSISDEKQASIMSRFIDLPHRPGIIERGAGLIPGAKPIIQFATGQPIETSKIGGAISEVLGAQDADKSLTRAAGEAIKQIAEVSILFKPASMIGGAVAGKLFPGVSAKAAGALAAGTSDEATALATRAASDAFKRRITSIGATNASAGTLFSLAHDLENGEFHPLETFIYSPLAMAALGFALHGAGVTLKRLGPVRTQEAATALQSDIGIKNVAADARNISDALTAEFKVPRPQADDLIFKAARGELNDTEFGMVRSLLFRNPQLMGSDFGLHLVRMMRPQLSLKVNVVDQPLSVTFEVNKTRVEETVLPQSKTEFHALLDRAKAGEITLLRAEGRARDLDFFRRGQPIALPPPRTADGSEPMPSAADVAMERAGAIPPPTPPVPGALRTQEELAMSRIGVDPRRRPLGEPVSGPVPSTELAPETLRPETEITTLPPERRPLKQIARSLEGTFAERAAIPPSQPERLLVLDRYGRAIPKLEPVQPTPQEAASNARLAPSDALLQFAADLAASKTGAVPKALLAIPKREVLFKERAEKAGGEYLGYQSSEGRGPDYLMITSPKLRASAGGGVNQVTIPVNKASVAAIRKALQEQEAAFAKTKSPEPPPPAPEGSIVHAGNEQVKILSNKRPHGVTVQTRTSGNMILPREADGTPDLPRGFVERAPESPIPFEDRKQDLAAQIVEVFRQRSIVRSSFGDIYIGQIDPRFGSVTLTDPITGRAYTIGVDALNRNIQEGKFLPGIEETSTLTNDGLLSLMESGLKTFIRQNKSGMLGMRVTGAAPTPVERAYELFTKVRLEYNQRLGRLGTPAEIDESEVSRLFRILADETGAVDPSKLFGSRGQRPTTRLTPIPESDILHFDAKAVGASASRDASGNIVLEFNFEGTRVPFTFGSRAEADHALRLMQKTQLEEARVTSIALKAGRELKLPPGEAPPNPRLSNATLRIDQMLYNNTVAPIDSPARYFTGRATALEKALLPVEVELRTFGKAGDDLATAFVRVRDIMERTDGDDAELLERAASLLTKEELQSGRVYRVLEGKETAPPDRTAAMRTFQQTLSGTRGAEQMSDARALGIRTATMLDKHLPHVFDQAILNNPEMAKNLAHELVRNGGARNFAEAERILLNMSHGMSEERAIQRIIRNDLARQKAAGHDPSPMTHAEASFILRTYVSKATTFIAGNMERERIGLDGFIPDIKKAYAVYFSRNNRRLAEAQVLGPEYEKAYTMIDRIQEESGGSAARYAQDVFELFIGKQRPQKLDGSLAGLYAFQAAKLTFSVVSNLTQPISTISRTNFRAFGRAFVKMLTEGKENRRYAVKIGALTHDYLNDLRIKGSQHAGESTFRRGTEKVADVASKGFQMTEDWVNRPFAARVGEEYFTDLVSILKANPTHKLTQRRISEIFGRDVTKEILSATPEDLAEMTFLAAKKISDNTQFKVDILSMPLFRNHPYGMFFYQFKNFALNQVKVVTQDFNYPRHRDPARFIRALAVYGAIYPAFGIAIGSLRDKLTGKENTREVLDDFFSDPTASTALALWGHGVAAAGTLGIVSDIARTTTMDSEWAMRSVFLPVGTSTLMAAWSTVSSALSAIKQGDAHEMDKAARAWSREFGTVGGAVGSYYFPSEGKGSPASPSMKGMSGGSKGMGGM